MDYKNTRKFLAFLMFQRLIVKWPVRVKYLIGIGKSMSEQKQGRIDKWEYD